MNKIRSSWIPALSFVFFLLNVSTSFGFSAGATLDRTKMSMGETVRLTVSTDERVSGLDADTSAIKDFDVLSSSSSSMTRIINGRMSVSVSLVMELSPKRPGHLKIPSFKVSADGESALTNPLEIEVTEDISASQGTGGNEDVFAESSLSSETIYMGQPVLYTFCLYFRQQISNPNLTLPDFKGFTPTELKSPSSYSKTINGLPYNVLEKNVLLTPIKSGRFTFDPALLVYAASSGVRRDFFGFPEAVMQKKSLRTGSNELEVRDLPPVPAGLDYSGFVGELSVKMKLEPRELKTGDSATLAIELDGKGGRVGDIGSPHLELPDSFKVYQDEPEIKEDAGSQGFSGLKTLRKAIVPTKPGDFIIAPVKITFFDSAKAVYRTIETEPIAVTVSEGETPLVAQPADSGRAKETVDSKKNPLVPANDIFHIKTSLDAIKNQKTMSFRWFLVLFTAPALIYCFSIITSRLMKNRETSSARLKREGLESLKKAGLADDPKAFLSLVHKALSCAVASKCGCSHESMTSDDLAKKLGDKNFDSSFVMDFKIFFEEVEMLRFSGVNLSRERMKEVMGSASSMVRKII